MTREVAPLILPRRLELDLQRAATLYGCSPAEIEEMRRLAAANPVAARCCFHQIAGEPPTDRRKT